MGALKNFGDQFSAVMGERMAELGEQICEDMRSNLQAAGHVDTGALIESIRQETVAEYDTVTTRIYADAENPVNRAKYAEFIELGTGAAHGREGGRVEPWSYQDSHGVWHTTDGMDPDPFIVPAVEKNIAASELREMIKEVIYDIEKYGRMKSNGRL